MRYEAIHSFVMLRGAKCDESLLRLRTAASSPAVRRTVPIPGVWLAAVEGRPITNRRSRLGRCAMVITSAATVWQDYLPSISPRRESNVMCSASSSLTPATPAFMRPAAWRRRSSAY